MEKDKITKQKIISTALDKWGKSLYTNMSLSVVADSLGVTKPALYRYFDSKEKLFDAILDTFVTDITTAGMKLLSEVRDLPFIELCRHSIKKGFEFFVNEEHASYFKLFMSPALKQIVLCKNKFHDVFSQFLLIVQNKIDYENLIIKGKFDARKYVRYFFYLSVFMFFYYAKYNQTDNKDLLKKYETFFDNLVSDIMRVIGNGLYGEDVFGLTEDDYTQIESNVIAELKNIAPQDKICQAIVRTIAKDGVIGASMENIAKQMGFSGKSSLYSHFKSRDEMFAMLFENEKNNIETFIKQAGIKYDNFNKNLYGSLSATWCYFVHDRNVLQYFDWLHYQMIKNEIKPAKSKISELFFNISQILNIDNEDKNVKVVNLPTSICIEFLSIYIIRDILDYDELTQEQMAEQIKQLRQLFLLYLRGLAI